MDYNKPCPWYNAIMTLRVLWLKENDPKTWKMLDILMDHLGDLKEEDKIMTGVVDFIRNHCKLTQFTEKEILHVMGNFVLIINNSKTEFCFRSY